MINYLVMKGQLFEIYECQRGDYLSIIEVWEQSVRATHHFITDADIAYFKPLILEQYLDHVKLFCTRDPNGKINAFLGVSEDKIEMLFVHPEYFGSGLGRKLLKFAIDQLQAAKVDVNEQNEKAVGFYKHMGFKVTSRSATDSLGKPFPILHLSL